MRVSPCGDVVTNQPEEQGIAREYQKSVAFEELPGMIEGLLKAYQHGRGSDDETFAGFTRRYEIDSLLAMAQAPENRTAFVKETSS